MFKLAINKSIEEAKKNNEKEFYEEIIPSKASNSNF
jgi:hypothetical protein